MSFVSDYAKKASFFGEDFPIAHKLLSDQPPMEIRRQILWAKLEMLNVSQLIETAKVYVTMPRELSYLVIGKKAPYPRMQALFRYVLENNSSDISTYDKTLYTAVLARYNKELAQHILIKLPDSLIKQYSLGYYGVEKPNQAQIKGIYVLVMLQELCNTLDNLWVCENCYNIAVPTRYVAPQYTSKMHELEFNKLMQMGDICLSFSGKDSYLDIMLYVEQCPVGHTSTCSTYIPNSKHNTFTPVDCYTISFYTCDKREASISFEDSMRIFKSNPRKVYFHRTFMERLLSEKRETAIPPYNTLHCKIDALDGGETIEELWGINFPRLEEFHYGSWIAPFIKTLYECVYQNNLVVEKYRATRDDVIEVQPIMGNEQGTAQASKNTQVSNKAQEGTKVQANPEQTREYGLARLIKYAYKGAYTPRTAKGGTHARPCEHQRAAHKRVLKSGKVIEVKSCTINKGLKKAVHTMAKPVG